MQKKYFLLLLIVFLGCKKEISKEIARNEKTTNKPIIRIKADSTALKIDTLLVVALGSEVLTEFYKSTNFYTVWQSKEHRKTILNEIENSENEGLRSADYKVEQLRNFEKKHAELSKSELVNYDLALTLSLQKYLNHLNSGKLNPKYLYKDWDIQIPKIDVNNYLYEGINTNSIAEMIEKCRPKDIVYKKLVQALKIIHSYPKDKIKLVQLDRKLTLNDTNIALKTIKKRLRYWNDLEGKDSVNSIYNKKTWGAVKKFQKRHGLAADGIIGTGTVTALNFTKTKREQQIIANLERMRWYNITRSENYLLINIPNYSLDVVEKKDTTMTKKIVVGTEKRKTPILNSTLKTVVLNPTWTVPPTILKEDVIPAMTRNRNYAKNREITIYDSNSKIVSPNNWSPKKATNYTYVQSPGIGNSLGQMKILFPNNHSVYLHDTNHRNLFGFHNRALSSGCVRVENPMKLVEHVLDDPTKWSPSKIDSVVKTKKTTAIKIVKNYDIYLWYWTAWSDLNTLSFREDIYNLDQELYDKLRN